MSLVLPDNEETRLAKLRELSIVDTERGPEFDALVDAAAAIFDCPIALISLVEAKEQWFKARCGLSVDGTSRDISFCQHAILNREVFVVEDALKDGRFKDNPLVTSDPFIRFYAGFPLSIDGEHNLGTLCVIDRQPRTPTEAQLKQLQRLAIAAEGLIKSHFYRLKAAEAVKEADRQRALAAREGDLLNEIAKLSGVGGWELDVETGKLTWTSKTYDIHGVPEDYIPTVEAAIEFYTEESRPVITKAVTEGMENGEPWDLELPFLTASGQHIWVRAAGRPVFENGKLTRLIGAFRDITNRKVTEHDIRRSEAIYRTTLEALTEGILLLDRDGSIRSVNPAAARMLDLPANALIGLNVLDLDFNFHAGDGKIETNPLSVAAMDPDKVSNHVTQLRKAGRSGSMWLTLNAVPIDAREYGLEGVVVSMTDTTELTEQAETLEVIFENFPGGVVHYDDGHFLVRHNEQFRNLLEYPDDIAERYPHLSEILKFNAENGEYGPGDPDELAKAKYRDFGSGVAASYERTRPNGTFLEVRSTPLPGGGIVASFVDVTSRKKIEKQLVENEQLARENLTELQTVLANMSQGVSVFDRNGELKHWNRQYIDIFGKPDNEVRAGVTLSQLIWAEKERDEFEGDPDEHVAELTSRLTNGDIVRSTFRHASGKVISTIHAPLPDGGWIGTHEDVTIRELAAEKIAYAAHHDTLTGLANRTLFNSKLEAALASAADGEHEGALLLLDLDRFKPVNDTFGHDVGDALLKSLAGRLKECVRSSDLVARLGGDEFGIILSNPVGGDSKVAEIADRIVSRVREPFTLLGHRIRVGISIGISRISKTDADTSPIIKRADLALYCVKKNGRNGFQYYDMRKAS